jgi:hypothetical protein
MPKRTVRGDEHVLRSGSKSSFEFSQNIAEEGACVASANGVRAHVDDDKVDASGQASDSFAPHRCPEMRRHKKSEVRTAACRSEKVQVLSDRTQTVGIKIAFEAFQSFLVKVSPKYTVVH